MELWYSLILIMHKSVEQHDDSQLILAPFEATRIALLQLYMNSSSSLSRAKYTPCFVNLLAYGLSNGMCRIYCLCWL